MQRQARCTGGGPNCWLQSARLLSLLPSARLHLQARTSDFVAAQRPAAVQLPAPDHRRRYPPPAAG